jgi:ribosome biogenesis GTPase
MTSSQKECLFLLGFSDFFESHAASLVSSSLFPARVINEERGLYRVQWSAQESAWASVTGKMQFSAYSRADFAAVGDWVLIENPGGSDRAIIHHVLPRKTMIQRKQVGSGSDVQIIASNVDTVFITTSMNEELNHRRIERYLTLAWDSGANPVILLTKSDVCEEDATQVLEGVCTEFPGVKVHALSKDDFEKAEFFAEYLATGKTAVVVGSSGVGKSTLVNFLIGREQIATQEIRESDGKGKHTTTSRSLYVSRYGGLIIDTPGMRELQLGDHAEGVQTQFSDVEAFMAYCKFSDCGHKSEPGCAIKKAIQEGSLPEERWRSYQKLSSEVRHLLRKEDKSIQAEDRKQWKKRSAQGRQNAKLKRAGFS